MSNDLFKKILNYSYGPLFAQLVSLIFLPIFTRVYTQETLGELQLIFTYLLILSPFVTLSFPSLIHNTSVTDESYFSIFIYYLAFSSITFTIVIVSLLSYSGVYLGLFASGLLFILVSVSAFNSYFQQYLVKLSLEHSYSKSYIIFSLVNNIQRSFWPLFISGSTIILFAYVISYIFSIFKIILADKILFRFVVINKRILINYIKLKFKSHFILSATQSLGVLVEWMIIPLIGLYLGELEIVAIVGVAHVISRTFPSHLANSLFNILINNGIKNQSFILRHFFVALLCICFEFFVFREFGAEVSIFLFGEDWVNTSAYIICMIPATFCIIFVIPYYKYYLIKKETNLFQIFIDLIFIVLNFIVIYHIDLEVDYLIFLTSLLYLIHFSMKTLYLTLARI